MSALLSCSTAFAFAVITKRKQAQSTVDSPASPEHYFSSVYWRCRFAQSGETEHELERQARRVHVKILTRAGQGAVARTTQPLVRAHVTSAASAMLLPAEGGPCRNTLRTCVPIL